VTRKTYVPADGYFARYLDIFTNPGTTDITVDLSMDSRFYHYPYDYTDGYDFAVRVASDPAIADTTSTTRSMPGTTWAVVDDINPVGAMPAVAFVYAGAVDKAPATVNFTKYTSQYNSSTVTTTFPSVTVPAGGSVALMNFLVQQTTTAAASASAGRLAQLPPEAIIGMSAEERQMVRNFTLPAGGVSTLPPLPAMVDGSVTGYVKDYAGELPTLPSSSASVYLQSSIPYYPRILSVSANSTTGLFTFVPNNFEGSSRRLIPRAAFTLNGSLGSAPFGVTADPVSGIFADGQSTAQYDLTFTAAGTAVATLTRFDGTAATDARVYLNALTGGYSRDFAATGNVYRRNFLPAGDYTLSAELPAPAPSSGSGVPMTGQLTVVAGQENNIALSFPQMGSIGGTVKNYNGLPMAGNRVEIRSTATTSNFYRAISTDGVGTFTFSDLPPDTYEIKVQDPWWVFYYPFTVAVAAGETVSRDFQYTLNGNVIGSVGFRTSIANYFPTWATIEIRETGSGKIITTTNSSSVPTFSTSRFAAPDAGKQYELRAWYSYGSGRIAETVVPLSAFTTNGQTIDVGTIALPLERGAIDVQLKDAVNAPFSTLVRVELRESDGTVVSYSDYVTGSYSFTGIYSGETTLTARATYNGLSYDAPVTVVPNGTATVTIVIPAFTGTLSGTVTSAAGTAVTNGFSYSLFRSDGTQMVCGQANLYVGYPINNYRPTDISECYSNDGSFRLQDINGTLRTSTFSSGEQLRLHFRSWALGEFDATFSYPDGTLNASVTVAIPVFDAQGVVLRADGSALAGGSLTMTVTDPVDPALVSTYSGYTAADGSYTIFGSRTGNFTITAQTYTGASGSVSGVISDISLPLAVPDITIEPTGSVSGSVTRNGTPVTNVDVFLNLPGRSSSLTTSSDANGAFSFADVPYAAFTVSGSVSSEMGSLSTNTYSGELSAATPAVADIPLAFSLLPGTIWGTVRDEVGTTYSWSTVTITRLSDGTISYAYTDGSGYYQLENMPADTYLVEASEWGSGGSISASISGVLVEGATLMVDLTLKPDVDLSYSYKLLPSGGLFDYTISSGGVLVNGSNGTTYGSPFNGLSYLNSGNFTQYSASRAWLDPVGQLQLPYAAMNGLVYSRKLYMQPDGGFIRYLDSVENHGAAAVSEDVYVNGSYTTPAAGAWSYEVDPAAVSGSYALESAADDSAMPKVGAVLSGDPVGSFAASPVVINSTPGAPDWGWKLAVPGGGRACILSFIFQGEPGNTTMATKAELLRNLTSDGNLVATDPLLGLTASDRACIKNFNVPPAP